MVRLEQELNTEYLLFALQDKARKLQKIKHEIKHEQSEAERKLRAEREGSIR